jgi:hypothetical protein
MNKYYKKMADQQDKIDNLIKVSKTFKIFCWEQYSVKDLTLFLEQTSDIINNEENIIKYSKPNTFQQNYVDSQKTLKNKLKTINIKYEKLLASPKFLN